uniref:BZIP domain-containing protein n=1 Tax=Cyanistes caeruleus TaxID=156563 RepID=A0A8C0ZA51_CYACU
GRVGRPWHRVPRAAGAAPGSLVVSKKDTMYWEKRRKNNEAAKRSREKRRLNDVAMESQLAALSRENAVLRTELPEGHRGASPLLGMEPFAGDSCCPARMSFVSGLRAKPWAVWRRLGWTHTEAAQEWLLRGQSETFQGHEGFGRMR